MNKFIISCLLVVYVLAEPMCPNGGKIKKLNAEFMSADCQTDYVEANTVCTLKCLDSHVANGPATVNYTCRPDGTWEFEKNIECTIASPCATFRELKKADEGTSYYLRFLSEKDFNKDKKNIFKSAGPESGKYIGYQDTKAASADLKIITEVEEASKFNVQVDEDEKGLRVYSLQKNNEKRIFSWSQSIGTGRGYFMYKSNKATEKADNSDANTRFHYDDFYSFYARPDNTNVVYPLAVCDQGKGTAIYKQPNFGHSGTKFCFEKIGSSNEPISEVGTDDLQENEEIEKEQKSEDVLLGEESTDNVILHKEETKEANLKTVVIEISREQNIKLMLKHSKKVDATQYREETPETQEKIQQFIAKALDNKTNITDKDVVDALKEYYNALNKEGSNAVSFGVLAAVMCMLVLN